VAAVDVLVARQAVYERDLSVLGYELLFRPVEDAAWRIDGAASHPGLMTATALFNSITIGLERLVGDRIAFCRADRVVLADSLAITLPMQRTVIEIGPDVVTDGPSLLACRRLVGQGWRLALEDLNWTAESEWTAETEQLIELASFVKIDISRQEPEAMIPLLSRCRAYGAQLLAGNVDSAELLERAEQVGFDLFQGHALSRPRTMSGRTLESSSAGRLRIAASLVGEEFEVAELERIIRTEPGLALQLLQLASVGARSGTRREVRTIRDALVLVGARRLQSWVALLLLTQPGLTRIEDVVVALSRARMAELLATRLSPWLAGLAFTAGMVSSFDLLLGISAQDVLLALPLSDDLREAAFGDTSVVGRLVRDVIDYQNGPDYRNPTDGEGDPGAGIRRSGLPDREFYSASMRALTWAVEATAGLQVA
jgi:c-di-GMP-related signal transduction protein